MVDRQGNHWRQRNSIYIALEEVDLTFSVHEVEEVQKMWDAGIHLSDMARRIKRKPDEVALLIFDRAMQGKIGQRAGGVYGSISPSVKLNSQIMGVMH